MITKFWINLPIADIAKSKSFFTELGFTVIEAKDNMLVMGFTAGVNNIGILLFANDAFEKFTRKQISNTVLGSELLLSIEVDSREAVENMFGKITKNGGSLFTELEDKEWLYGFGFEDLDGHRWNIVYMDATKMPQ